MALFCIVALQLVFALPALADEGGEGPTLEPPVPPVVEPPIEPPSGEPELPSTPPTTPPVVPPIDNPVETPKPEVKIEPSAPTVSPPTEVGTGGGRSEAAPSPDSPAPTTATAAAPTAPAAVPATQGARSHRSTRHAATASPVPPPSAHSGQPSAGQAPDRHAAGGAPAADSPDAVEGASRAASDFGEVITEALPTGPMAKIGTLLATEIGLVPHGSEKAERTDAGRIGVALGTALIGTRVGDTRPPSPPASKPLGISFAPSSGGGRTIFLVLFWALAGSLALFVCVQLSAALGGRGPIEWLRSRPRAVRLTAAGWSVDRALEAGHRAATTIRWRAKAVAARRHQVRPAIAWRANAAASALRRLAARASAGLAGLRSFF